MHYIQRSIEFLVASVMQEYPAVLITGPKEIGKSTLLEHIIEQSGHTVPRLTLDDLTERQLAVSNPAMFFQLHNPPLSLMKFNTRLNFFLTLR